MCKIATLIPTACAQYRLYIELHISTEKVLHLSKPQGWPQIKDMKGQQPVRYSLGCGASCDSLDILALSSECVMKHS